MTAPAISNADAATRNLSGKTRTDRPTYGELSLANELAQAKEEIRRLRMHGEFLGQGYRLLAQIANGDAHKRGESPVVTDAIGDTNLPARLVSEK
jgi:hypothetical protein